MMIRLKSTLNMNDNSKTNSFDKFFSSSSLVVVTDPMAIGINFINHFVVLSLDVFRCFSLIQSIDCSMI